MQVRTLPSLILPRLPTGSPQRAVAPVAAQDERSQATVDARVRSTKPVESADVELLTRRNQRYSYVKVDVNGSTTSRAVQTYFNIQAQEDQERSQALFGIDILA